MACMRGLAATLLAAAVSAQPAADTPATTSAPAAPVLSIGLMLPFEDKLDCVGAWEAYHMARVAARIARGTPWFASAFPAGTTIGFETLPGGGKYGSAYGAYQAATAWVGASPPPAGVTRIGLVGPPGPDAAAVVGMVTTAAGMPLLSTTTAATAASTSIAAASDNFVFRVGHSDADTAEVLARLLLSTGWRQAAILSPAGREGDARVAALRAALAAASAGRAIGDGEAFSASVSVSFVPGDSDSVDAALAALVEATPRVVVLLAPPVQAALVMRRAYDTGVYGKGWTWIGDGWVRERTALLSAALDVPASWNVTTGALDPNGADDVMGSGDVRRRLSSGAAAPAASTVSGSGAAPPRKYSTDWSVFTSRGTASSALYWEDAWKAWNPADNVAAVTTAMAGAVGVVAPRIPADQRLAGVLDRFSLAKLTPPAEDYVPGSPFPPPGLPTTSACPVMFLPPIGAAPGAGGASGSVQPGTVADGPAPYVFDAVWGLLAGAAAAAKSAAAAAGSDAAAAGAALPAAPALRAGIAAALTNGGAAAIAGASPLTGLLFGPFSASGERLPPLPLAVVNTDTAGKVTTVATWAVAPDIAATLNTTSVVGADGLLQPLLLRSVASTGPAIVWPGGDTHTPPDRALAHAHGEATALFTALLGVAVSLLVGSVLHHAHVTALPESGATVLVGVLFGFFLRVIGSHATRASAEFSEATFMLVLLPIIIGESGYSLNRKPFFAQLGSILMYAILGTLVSALVIGAILTMASAAGIMSFSFEEAMSFASLLSATDPVATLAVFSSLKVDSSLNALVYGESVLNDAVGIVLYRTFTRFLTTPISLTALVGAALSFILILVVSTVIGVFVGLVATIAFRAVNVSGQGRMTRWEKRLAAKIEGMRRAIAVAAAATGTGGLLGAVVGSVEDEDAHGKEATVASASEHVAAPAPAPAPAAGPTPAFIAAASAKPLSMSIDLTSGVAETGILLLFAYASFALAESCGMSGIVSVLVFGIVANHYTRRILTRDGKAVSTAVFKMLATLADCAVFFQIGLNVALHAGVGAHNGALIFVTLIACLIGRAANIFPLTAWLNRHRKEPIPFNFQLALFHAGLRGAIAYVSALSFPSQNRDVVVNATSWIVLITLFGMGGTTVPTLRRLNIPFGIEEPPAPVRAAAVAQVVAASPTKAAMVWADKWIRRVVLGHELLVEVAAANAAAVNETRSRVARELGLSPEAIAALPVVAVPEEDVGDTAADSDDEDENDEKHGVAPALESADAGGHLSSDALPRRRGVFVTDAPAASTAVARATPAPYDGHWETAASIVAAARRAYAAKAAAGSAAGLAPPGQDGGARSLLVAAYGAAPVAATERAPLVAAAHAEAAAEAAAAAAEGRRAVHAMRAAVKASEATAIDE